MSETTDYNKRCQKIKPDRHYVKVLFYSVLLSSVQPQTEEMS